MAFRFVVPDSPAAGKPATPDKTKTAHTFGLSQYSEYDDSVSMTPDGPPPTSNATFTPFGAPSNSFLETPGLGSLDSKSLAQKKNPGRSLFGRSNASNAPLGRSIRGKAKPSGLSRQFIVDDSDEEKKGEENQEAEDEEDGEATPPIRGSVFRRGFTPAKSRAESNDDASLDVDAEIERYLDEEMEADDGEAFEEDMSEAASDEGDLFLNLRHDDRPYGQPLIGEEEDLLMMNTPAATARVRKEAERIYKRSMNFGASTRTHKLQFGAIAKDIYTQQEAARITESPDLILKTEALMRKLYDDGVGTQEDLDKLHSSLADVTYQLIKVWTDYVDQLPPPEGEDLAGVGPSEAAEPFEKAAFVAHLILRMHHTRFESQMDLDQTPPLPEILFDWMQTSHNLYPNQIREILRYQPSPACHSLYWQTLRNTLLRGDAAGAKLLLKDAGWEHVRRGARGEKAYTGKALENVRRFVDATCEMLEQCPASKNDWDIFNSTWTLFRVQARGSLDRLTLFAEGRDTSLLDSRDDQVESLSNMARKASSQIPWDIYENLQTIYGIVLGNPEAILEIAQDWCEATVGLFGWWDENGKGSKDPFMAPSQSLRFGASTAPFGNEIDPENYFERLVTVFHQVVDYGLSPNTMNPIEVAIASAFEGNASAIIGCLRIWSIPVACSVAEIAALGRWLPSPEPVKAKSVDDLDMDDLLLLGLRQPNGDEAEGIKDATLVIYARELAGIDQLSPQLDGWEIAIQVLGRMDVPEKSEETVGELLRDLLATLDETSSPTVDKMWKILSDLGMMNYAEETAESFAEILAQKSHRYGDALWYFALSHRTDRVREVLNLLMSYSLVQSTVYPTENELDECLKNLLRKRTETLEERAKQDLEAAQLLGCMLSGYATLRKFYELRDEVKAQEASPSKALALKKQAAFALVAVISSSGDNIRGGLYDETRDAVVSEDFLLALLGEATAFINQSPSLISLEQIDILLKAVEDIQTVGTRVYETCEEFFRLVLSSGHGLKGSTPQDLMRSTNLGSSFMMSGSTLLKSHMQKSILTGGKVSRGWDWRQGWTSNTKGEDVLRKLRLGLAKDLAALWLEDADGVAMY